MPPLPIPQEWVESYIEVLKKQADYFDDTRREATMIRAEYAQDMLDVWRSKSRGRRDDYARTSRR